MGKKNRPRAKASGKKPPSVVLQTMKHTIALLEITIADLRTKDPKRRQIAITNILTFGITVLDTAPRLMGWKDWFATYYENNPDDGLLEYMRELRRTAVHEGELAVAAGVTFHNMYSGDVRAIMNRHRPPGATDIFIGDALGGSGWFVPMPDGSKQHYYVELPEHFGSSHVTIEMFFINPPEAFKGEQLGETAARFVSYLKNMVEAASLHWK